MDDKETKDAIAAAVFAATAELTLKQLRSELDELWRWKKESEPILIWAKGFMETYKNTVRIVVASGAITVIGLLIQVYYTLNKGK